MAVKSNRFLNWMIVAVVILLATLPVMVDQFRLEAARWHLAAAANAAGADQGEVVETRLEAASKWVPEIEQLRDYWLFRIKQAIDESPEELVAMVEEAIAKDAGNIMLGIWAADELYARAEFAVAVEVLESSLPPEARASSFQLNQLAYMRALAGIELDIALEDINRALEVYPDSDAMRDTRAWVLFQMGRPQEALEDANFAVESISSSTDSPSWSEWLLRKLEGKRLPTSPDNTLTRREAGNYLWAQGALYYHRARILETLGRTDAAERDYQWLRQRSLPTDGRIY